MPVAVTEQVWVGPRLLPCAWSVFAVPGADRTDDDGCRYEPLPERGPSAPPARRTVRYTVDREIVGNLEDVRDRVLAAAVQLDQPLRRLFGGGRRQSDEPLGAARRERPGSWES
jgi:hypothetical protein